MKRELVRINYNIPRALLDRVDEYSEKVGLNRTSALNSLIGISLESHDAIQATKILMKALEEKDSIAFLKQMSEVRDDKDA